MTYSQETLMQVKRERITESKIRSIDASEIVDWIHKLEDNLSNSVDALERLKSELADVDLPMPDYAQAAINNATQQPTS